MAIDDPEVIIGVAALVAAIAALIFAIIQTFEHRTLGRGAPGLESAAWCQFLVNFQDVWWGHANIRWEWRLATMIPLDVYGATIETTMADLRLLAAMGGMHASTDAAILARTRCGEMLMGSHHLVLGRMVYYRLGRENIRPRITGNVLTKTSRFLHCIVAVQNHAKKRSATTGIPSSNNSNASREAVATLLSRPRTEFDAQIDCSLGNNMWLFTTPTFKILSNGLHAPDLDWSAEEARIFFGPLGQGIGGCSCLACCREWMAGTAHLPGRAIKADVNLVRVVMAAIEEYSFAVRKVIGGSNMWDGPVGEGFDDFGPVVLGA
ncbi:hypothetical protein C8A01DRAFT_38320 [Parachaetomium inaequale]|uniref:Uncharacterized protein n=1 Tax=Parachaetomium inaequale TaxID=2588326 RepID=A0AAN6PEG3_9PEZI|nr:hypothetical protein C8A01DRAFT_38320 [Parachaetomium inaequale]